jgi:Glycosyl transferase family 2
VSESARPFAVPSGPSGLEPGKPPTFSVVICAYQAAHTIGAAVESALVQTVPAHEVIVVDDGSTDDTRVALRSYRHRITYIHQDNRGAAAASNVAVREAKGDFVAILDADDAFEPERLEALVELAVQRPDLDILMTDAYLEVDGETVGRFGERTPFAVADQPLEIFERCFIAWPAVRRATLNAVGGFDETLRIGYDWECWIRLLHRGAAAGLVDQPLLRYRISGAGSLTDDRVAALRSRVQILERAACLDLTPAERRAVERFVSARRRRAMLAEADQALLDGRPDRRRRAFEVARTSGIGPRIRINALAAMLAPRLAARRLAALEAKTGASRTKRWVPRP